MEMKVQRLIIKRACTDGGCTKTCMYQPDENTDKDTQPPIEIGDDAAFKYACPLHSNIVLFVGTIFVVVQ